MVGAELRKPDGAFARLGLHPCQLEDGERVLVLEMGAAMQDGRAAARLAALGMRHHHKMPAGRVSPADLSTMGPEWTLWVRPHARAEAAAATAAPRVEQCARKRDDGCMLALREDSVARAALGLPALLDPAME